MNFLRKAERAFDKIMNAMLLLSAVIIIVDTILVAQDVIIRKAADYTWAPLYEILTYSLVWMTFLGTTAIYRDDGHVKLDSFIQMIPERAQKLARVITSCLVAILCIFMCFLTARLTLNDALNDFVLASILNPPKWPLEIIIPIAFFMLFIQAIRHTVRYVEDYRAKENPENPEAPESASEEGGSTVGMV